MNLESILEQTFVINLEKDINRFNHSIFELSKLGITDYSIIKAIKYDHESVKKLYRENVCSKIDSCFRCDDVNYKYAYCTHENNILTPPQVANFLSFKKVMEKSIHTKKLMLVLEDDFYLTYNYLKAFKNIKNFCLKKNLVYSSEPILIRIGSHTEAQKKYKLKFKIFNKNSFIKDKHNMANPAFIYNNTFSKLFLREFKRIETTSDNFIHKHLCLEHNVLNYSVYPFPISQHTHRSKLMFLNQILTVVKKVYSLKIM